MTAATPTTTATSGASGRAVRFWTASAFCILLAACAGPGSRPPATTAQKNPQINPAQRTEVVMTALSLLDTRYQYGGARFQQGFDCSGLVKYVFGAATRTDLPHNTDQIAQMSRRVKRSQLQPGDLVFFNTTGQSNSHMGIYLGDNRFINAPSTGGQVRIDDLSTPYYRRHFESVGTLFAR